MSIPKVNFFKILLTFFVLSVLYRYGGDLMSNYETKRIFSNNLSRLLDSNGITQIEFAKKMNVAASTVSSWCNGDKMPRMDKVEWMAEFFGVPRTSLIDDISKTGTKFRFPVSLLRLLYLIQPGLYSQSLHLYL